MGELIDAPDRGTIVVLAYYNRTAWVEDAGVPMVASTDPEDDRYGALVRGEYHADHVYESAWGAEIAPCEDAAEWLFVQLNDPGAKEQTLPNDRTMCVGDIAVVCHTDGRVIGAWVCQFRGWAACPEFAQHLQEGEL